MKKMTYAEWQEELERLFNEWLWATNKWQELYLQYQYELLHKEHWFFSFLEKMNF